MRSAFVVAAGGAALALTACGGVSVDPVAKAADRAVAKGSEHVTFRGTVTAAGRPVRMSGAGDFQNQARLGRAHLAIDGAGVHMTMDEVLSGSTIYMSSPLFTKSLPQGKHWLSLDLERADKLGMNFNAYAQQSPADTLEALRKAGSVKKVGEETIDGRPTTHYRATVDYSKIPNGAKVQELTKLKAAPIDVWIGSDRLPRRMRVTYSTNAAGSVVSASMTMDFSNYGEPVHVQVPAANDTIDFTKLGGNP